jgi:hypothetical protein
MWLLTLDIDVEHCPNCGAPLEDHRLSWDLSKGRDRRSAGDRQDPQPSGPANPRPAALPSSSSRSIPNDLNKAKPLADASRRRGSLGLRSSGAMKNLSRLSRPLSDRCARYNRGFFIKHKPTLRYSSGHRKGRSKILSIPQLGVSRIALTRRFHRAPLSEKL